MLTVRPKLCIQIIHNEIKLDIAIKGLLCESAIFRTLEKQQEKGLLFPVGIETSIWRFVHNWG